MNYNRMFDLLFSEAITEDVKLTVVEKVRGNINEGVVESSPLTVLLSTLVYEEEVTEEALNDIIDIVFEGMTEDEIERVLEEFKRDTVVYIMEWDPAPVGLRGVEREAAKQQAKQNQPKAIDKLKSAAGKVKTWAGNVTQRAAAGIKAGVEKVKQAANQPTGLDKLKQMRSEMIKQAVEKGTAPVSDKPLEKPEPPKAEEPKVEPTAAKAKKAAAPKATKKAAPKVTPQSEPEAPKTTKKAVASKATKKVAPKVEPKVEAPKVAKKTVKKATTTAKSAGKKVADVIKAAEAPKEPVAAKRGRKKVNEALEEAIILLTNTNISEASLVEIVEMISNKKAAEKAVERDYKNFTKAVDVLNKAEEDALKIGVPADPEVLGKLQKNAQEKGEHYEKFKALADKKFGEECK